MAGLFPHNQKVYDKVLTYFEEVNKVAVVQATGTGKGYLASEFVNVAFKNKNILILTPNTDIIKNYEKSLGVKPGGRVKLYTYPTIMSWYKRGLQGNKEAQEKFMTLANKTDLLITDEFHRLGAKEWGAACQKLIDLIDKNNKKILGLTATPIRYNDLVKLSEDSEDGRGEKKSRNMADEVFEGNLIQGVTLEEAVYNRILPSFKYVLGSYGYESALAEGFERLEDMRQTYGSSNQAIRNLERNLRELSEKFGPEKENLRKLIQKEIKDIGNYQKWIVFCSNSEQLKNIDEELSYWFEKPLNKYKSGFQISETALNLYSVYSDEPTKENESNLEAFYDANQGLNIIKCINKLNEGAHVANITGIIMLRGTQSPIVYLQQIGRALSAGNKNNPIIFDFMGNFENMQRVSDGEDGFVNSIRKSSKMVSEYNKGERNPEFLSQSESQFYNKGQKRDPYIRIVDNNILSMSKLFGNIQDILHSHSSLTWSNIELAILDKYYPLGGANAVLEKLKKKSVGIRSIDAINKKAKDRGLVFNMKTGEVKQNTDNTLEWTPEEDKIIQLGFESFKGRTAKEIAIIIHRDKMRNRKPEQILNRYQHIKNGRGAKGKDYARNGLRWSRNELYMLEKNYEVGLPLEIISAELERSPEAILSKAQELGLYRSERTFNNKKGEWTPEEEDFLFNNMSRMSKKELSEKLGRSVSSIDKKIIRMRNEKYYQRRIESHHGTTNPRNWTELEEHLLFTHWGESWDELCHALEPKTPKQIKAKVLADCKKYGDKNPYKDDENFKKIV